MWRRRRRHISRKDDKLYVDRYARTPLECRPHADHSLADCSPVVQHQSRASSAPAGAQITSRSQLALAAAAGGGADCERASRELFWAKLSPGAPLESLGAQIMARRGFVAMKAASKVVTEEEEVDLRLVASNRRREELIARDSNHVRSLAPRFGQNRAAGDRFVVGQNVFFLLQAALMSRAASH